MVEGLDVKLWGALLRMLQAVVEASPTILIGLFCAGIFRRMVGRPQTLRLFGGNGRLTLPIAWLVGMLLPVCSFGVFPILRELRKAGLAGGAILGFALAAPLFNPLSFLYGLTLSEPWVIISFTFASLAIVTGVGLLWDWLLPEKQRQEPQAEPEVEYGAKRLLAVLTAAAREATGPMLLYLLVGLLGVALLAIVFPFTALQELMKYDDPLAPLEMLGVALPAYDPPLRAMMQLGQMFDHGNSVGAALVLLVFGAGANLGLLAWIAAQYGWRRLFGWFLLTLAIVLVCAYALNPLFPPVHIEDHTHGFDDFVAPFPEETRDPAAQILPRLLDRFDHHPHEIVGCAGIVLLMVLGLLLRLLDPVWSIESWLERRRPSAERTENFWNRPLPTWLLVATAVVGLVAFSVIGCYLYYPAPALAFAEMRPVKAYVLSSLLNSREEEFFLKEARRWDDLTRRLEVGIFLRTFQLDPELREMVEEFREKLEETRDAVRLKRPLNREEAMNSLFKSYEAIRKHVGKSHELEG